MIKAVLFDLDGTLLNTNDLIMKSFRLTFEHYFKDRLFSDEEIIDCIGPTLHQTGAKYYPQDVEGFVSTYRTYYVKYHDELINVFDGVEGMLKQLKELGLILVVVTSKKKDMTIKGLNHTNLLDYFDLIVSSDDIKCPKPNPEPIEYVLKELKLKPEEVMMVGDNSHDIECAQQAFVKSVGVGWALRGADYLRSFNPTYIIGKAKELIEIVKREGV